MAGVAVMVPAYAFAPEGDVIVTLPQLLLLAAQAAGPLTLMPANDVVYEIPLAAVCPELPSTQICDAWAGVITFVFAKHPVKLS